MSAPRGNFNDTKATWNRELDLCEKSFQENTAGEDQQVFIRKFSALKTRVYIFDGTPPYLYGEIKLAIEELSKVAVWCGNLGKLNGKIAALENFDTTELKTKATAILAKLKSYDGRDGESAVIIAGLAELSSSIDSAKMHAHRNSVFAEIDRSKQAANPPQPAVVPAAPQLQPPRGFGRFLSLFCCCGTSDERRPLLDSNSKKGYKRM